MRAPTAPKHQKRPMAIAPNGRYEVQPLRERAARDALPGAAAFYRRVGRKALHLLLLEVEELQEEELVSGIEQRRRAQVEAVEEVAVDAGHRNQAPQREGKGGELKHYAHALRRGARPRARVPHPQAEEQAGHDEQRAVDDHVRPQLFGRAEKAAVPAELVAGARRRSVGLAVRFAEPPCAQLGRRAQK